VVHIALFPKYSDLLVEIANF